MAREQIASWTIILGGFLAILGFAYYLTHNPATITTTVAGQATENRELARTLNQVGCASDMEGRDNGTAPAESVAKTIIAKCGPVHFSQGPPCSPGPKCVQMLQQANLQVETKYVLEARHKRAQALADDAKAALERGQPH